MKDKRLSLNSILAGLAAGLFTMAPVLANDLSTLGDKVIDFLGEVFGFMNMIVYPLGGIALVVAIAMILLSADDRKVDGAKAWAKRVIIGLIIYGSLGLVVQALKGSINKTIGTGGIEWSDFAN